MKLDDLKDMNIPHLAPIEVEYQYGLSFERDKLLGYFRKIEMEGNSLPQLTHYNSPNGPFQIPERYYSIRIDQIRSVTMLVPKTK